MEGTILFPEPIYNKQYTTVTGTYSLLAQIENPSVILFVQNLTAVTVTFSFDGVNDHFKLPQSGYLLLDVSANKSLARPLNFQSNQCIYVKGAPTSGEVNLTTFYVVR